MINEDTCNMHVLYHVEYKYMPKQTALLCPLKKIGPLNEPHLFRGNLSVLRVCLGMYQYPLPGC